jgi:Skp family chaperone for outer membrane proteins
MAAMAVGGMLAVAQVQAQQPPSQGQAPSAAPSRAVGVIDVGYILQNHPTLKSKMEGIKSAMEAADNAMKAKRENIMKQMEQLKEKYNEGTPEYDRAEKQIAEQDTEFRLELVKKRKEFEHQQAEIMFEVHTQLTQLLRYVSEQMGFQAILQVSRQTVDAKKPETLDLAMSQNVLYFDKNVDLTDWVLNALKQQLGQATQPAAQPAARSAAQPGVRPPNR